MFYLGYNTNGLPKHSLEESLELAAQNGFTALGLTVDYGALEPNAEQTASQLETLCRWKEQRQFHFVLETGARFLLNPNVKHEPTLISPSVVERFQRIEFYKRVIDIAAQIGADCVSIWSGRCPDGSGRTASTIDAPGAFLFWYLIEGLAQTLDYAEKKGVLIAFEPEPGMFISTMDDFQLLLNQLNQDERLKLTIDVGHLVCNDEPVRETILRWKDRLVNIHLEDMNRGEHKHLPFGQGVVNIDEVFRALRDANYNRGVYVELSRESPLPGKRGWRALTTPEERSAFEDEANALIRSAQTLKKSLPPPLW